MNEKWEWFLALAALGASVWSRLRVAINWMFGIVFVTNEVQFDMVQTIIAFLQATGKIKERQRGTNLFRYTRMHVRPLDRSQMVIVQDKDHQDHLFWQGIWPIFYHYVRGEENCTFNYIRGTVNWKQFLWDVVQWEDAQRRASDDNSAGDRFNITKSYGSEVEADYDNDAPVRQPLSALSKKRRREVLRDNAIPLHWKPEDLGESHEASSLDMLALTSELVDVVEEARFWKGSEAWYKARGIPWRRGYRFKGQPGSGKTSLARAMAEDLDLPVYCIDLASMSNRIFSSSWANAMCAAPCMIVLEDIDAVFKGRENISKAGGGLTYDCLLNEIDGLKRPDGLLLVITTNNADALDPALCRSGRTDREVEFLPLDRAGRMKLAMRIVDDVNAANELADAGALDMAADFQERCFRVALANRYKNQLQIVIP